MEKISSLKLLKFGDFLSIHQDEMNPRLINAYVDLLVLKNKD